MDSIIIDKNLLCFFFVVSCVITAKSAKATTPREYGL